MNDGSSPLTQKNNMAQELKYEWSLLVHSFIESSETEKQTFFEKIQSSGITRADLKLHTKNLSQTRKNLNLNIEKIKSQIDHLNSVTENLELVGSDTESIQEQINKLNLMGEKLSSEVISIEKQIKKLRQVEEILT